MRSYECPRCNWWIIGGSKIADREIHEHNIKVHRDRQPQSPRIP